MGTLTVQTLQAPTSGANANKVLIPSGHTLDASNGLTTPAGHVIQTAYTHFNTETSNTSETFADVSGASISFTPKFASSNLIITTTYQMQVYSTSSSFAGGMVRIVHDGTNLDWTSQHYENYREVDGNTGGVNFHFRDTKFIPVAASNTSARTIKLQIAKYGSNTTHAKVNQGAYYWSVLKVEEIAQ